MFLTFLAIWFPPFLTVWLFASSAVCGQRLTTLMDSMWANFFRLTGACLLLGMVTLLIASPPWETPQVFWRFYLSGMVGFGLGDIGLFLAYARIGSRLTILVNLCLAPLFAAAGEFFLLGNTIEWVHLVAMGIILAGVGVAISPGGKSKVLRTGAATKDYLLGLAFAVVAGFGQGFGAVLSRFADQVPGADSVLPLSQAFQRCLGGWSVVLIVTLLAYPRLRRIQGSIFRVEKEGRKGLPFWMLGAIVFGPALGVTCFQWSLITVGNSALVQAFVSTTPIALIPLAYFIEKDVPTPRSLVGAVIAVSGVLMLCLW